MQPHMIDIIERALFTFKNIFVCVCDCGKS